MRRFCRILLLAHNPTTSTNGLVYSSTSQTGVTTTFVYDAFQREVSQTDGRGNTTRTVYDSLGRVASTIDALGHATAYGYDALGRQISVTDPLTNTVTTAYDAEGRVVSQRGATYPVDYSYDEFGDKVSMTTYRNAGGPGFVPAAGDTTRWLRDEATGLVTNKVYADGKGPRYDYTPEGKLATRIWARGIATTYSYDANGALTNTVYSDGTPTITLAYNRAGRQIQAIDAAGVTTFLYDDFGALTNETVVGVAGTNTIERFYDNFGRDAGYALNGVRQSTLAYDPATGRLVTMEVPVSDGSSNNSPTPTPNSNFFTWSYLAGSDLKSSLTYPNGLTASWQYDANGQLLQVKNAFPTNTISQYDYTYDAAGRRISVSKSGTAFDQGDTISYGYNEKSELTNAVASVDSDYRYAYAFDDIGNRESSSERGTNSVYTANNLNQYTAVDDFTPQFDDDGNQTLIKTATGIWSVTYNGENRPIRWENVATNFSTPALLSMSYDRMGRRITKNAQRFVYSGYLQIANFELHTSNLKFQTFIWDPTAPVATSPLVWNSLSIQPFDILTSYYTRDGNKNISEVAAENGDIAAHYEYTPFGAVIAQSGTSAASNPWRFSSEYAEDDTATVYYNYRHYEPVMGKWLSRDPVMEQGGPNLNCFVSNEIGREIDRLGCHELHTKIYLHPIFQWTLRWKYPVIGAPGQTLPDISDLEWVKKMTSFDKLVDVAISWDGYCTGEKSDWPIIESVALSSYDVVGYLDYLTISLADIVPLGHKVNKVLEEIGIEINIEISSGWYLKMSGEKQKPSRSGSRHCIEKTIHLEVVERRFSADIDVSGSASIGGKTITSDLGGMQGVSYDVSVAKQSIKLKQCCCPSYTESSIVGGQDIDSEGIDRSRN